MTEEIFVDGVNVAECRHCMYKGFKAFPQCRLELDSFATACTQHKDCYYKQLKRLEQENKELKARVKAEIHLGNNYKKDFAEQVTIAENYRSALEEIKKFLDNSLMVTNVGTKQMIYYADFFEFKNDLKEKIDEVLNA